MRVNNDRGICSGVFPLKIWMSNDYLKYYALGAAVVRHLVLETIIEQHDFAFSPTSPFCTNPHLCTIAPIYAESKMKLEGSVATAEVWPNPRLGIYGAVASTNNRDHAGVPQLHKYTASDRRVHRACSAIEALPNCRSLVPMPLATRFVLDAILVSCQKPFSFELAVFLA